MVRRIMLILVLVAPVFLFVSPTFAQNKDEIYAHQWEHWMEGIHRLTWASKNCNGSMMVGLEDLRLWLRQEYPANWAEQKDRWETVLAGRHRYIDKQHACWDVNYDFGRYGYKFPELWHSYERRSDRARKHEGSFYRTESFVSPIGHFLERIDESGDTCGLRPVEFARKLILVLRKNRGVDRLRQGNGPIFYGTDACKRLRNETVQGGLTGVEVRLAYTVQPSKATMSLDELQWEKAESARQSLYTLVYSKTPPPKRKKPMKPSKQVEKFGKDGRVARGRNFGRGKMAGNIDQSSAKTPQKANAATKRYQVTERMSWADKAKAQPWTPHKPRPWLSIALPADYAVMSQQFRDKADAMMKSRGMDARGLAEGFQATLSSSSGASLVDVVIIFLEVGAGAPTQADVKGASLSDWRLWEAQERKQMELRVKAAGKKLSAWHGLQQTRVGSLHAAMISFEMDFGSRRSCRKCPRYRVLKHVEVYRVLNGAKSFDLKLIRDSRSGPIIQPTLEEIKNRLWVQL